MAATEVAVVAMRARKRTHRTTAARVRVPMDPGGVLDIGSAGAWAREARERSVRAIPIAVAFSLLLHAAGVAVLSQLASTPTLPRAIPIALLVAPEEDAASAWTTSLDPTPAPSPKPIPRIAARKPLPRPAIPVAPESPALAGGSNWRSDIVSAPSDVAPSAAPLLEAAPNAVSSSGPGSVVSGQPPGANGAVGVRRVRGGYQVRPAYPARALRLGVEGTALLKVRVAADGRVRDVQLEGSAGDDGLDRSARDAVRRWRFEVAPDDASQEDVWVLVPIEFRLQDRSP